MKKYAKALLALSLLSASTLALAAPDAAMQADNQAINSACASDAQAASCGSEVVGKGLLICLHKYKKANPSYKFSSACKAAMEQRHTDKKAGK